MKYLVLNPITQGLRLESGAVHERQLIEGDTIELDGKEAAELIACGAINSEPIADDGSDSGQSNLAEIANPGTDTSAPNTGESSGAEQSNPADTSTTSDADVSAPPVVAAATAKKANTKAAK